MIKMNKQKITKDMLIGDVVKEHPEAIEVMLDHGMQCVGCHVATWETIEQGAQGHGVNSDKLVEDINKKLFGDKNDL